ncbi:MAG TPA: hypothetical protein VMS32_02230 [Verrucomicrobiae bacterium]|jgi:hypothetical protein|nr:hypothetical protein [Verrucomicrobiae bacterium]
MFKIVPRTTVATVFVAALGLGGLAPALADNGQALATTVVAGANAGIKSAMTRVPKGTVAQVPPVQQQPVGGPTAQGLPTGFTYTADVSSAYPYGDIGKTGKAWLPGGVDLVGGYGFNPTTRVVASYYELQHYPVGFNSGTVPLYLQGSATPLDPAYDLSTGPQINVTTKDRFLILSFEKLFMLGNVKGRPIPIVISPTYVARTSKIAASTSNNDIVPFEPNAPNGFPVLGVYTRTAQYYSLAFTLPFLKTPKMFGTYTAAPTTLVHTAGINQENHTQIYQILYLEYTPNDRTRFFFEPQSSRDYLPTDQYAQHLPAYFLGAAERIGRSGFVQLVLNSGGPTNEGAYGVTALTCQALPCGSPSSQVVPTVGGLKATQIQVQFGIGSPSYIPF